MVVATWTQLTELSPRARLLWGAVAALVLLLGVVLVIGRGAPERDLQVADSGAGNAAATTVPAPTVPAPATPVGTQPATAGSGVAPLNISGGSSAQAVLSGRSEADIQLERSMNSELPPKPPARVRPEQIAAKAPEAVRTAGASLARWSSALTKCLDGKDSSPRDCLVVADKAEPGVQYQDGSLIGDVQFEVFRETSDGTRVWLIYTDGVDCRGYGTNFEKCAAW